MLTLTFEDERYNQAVKYFNGAHAYLESECAESIKSVDPEELGRRVHLINQYDWLIQVYLRRMVNLSCNYADMLNKDESLMASIINRSIIETFAHFHCLLNEIIKLVSSKKFTKVYHLLASHLLSGNHGFLPDDVKIKKFNVIGTIREADKTYAGIKQEYDWLSEFVHPNSPSIISFSEENIADRKISFFAKPKDIAPNQGMGGVFWVGLFVEEWNKALILRSYIIDSWCPVPPNAVAQEFKSEPSSPS